MIEEGQSKEVLTASSHSKIKGQEIKPESYRFKTNCMFMLHNFLLWDSEDAKTLPDLKNLQDKYREETNPLRT